MGPNIVYKYQLQHRSFPWMSKKIQSISKNSKAGLYTITHDIGCKYLTCHLAAHSAQCRAVAPHPANSDSKDVLDWHMDYDNFRDYQEKIAPLLPVSELFLPDRLLGCGPCGQRPCRQIQIDWLSKSQ